MISIHRLKRAVISLLVLVLPFSTEALAQSYGLAARPDNQTCLAPDRPTIDSPVELDLALYVEGVTPMKIVQSPADDSWLLLSRKGRVIRYADGEDFTYIQDVLDIQDRVTLSFNGGGGEFGALGMALHPAYATNGEVFIFYTHETDDDPAEYYARLSRFHSEPDGSLDADSEEIILSLTLTRQIHVGGDIAFGTDGYLYIGTGDGGIYGSNGSGTAQDPYNLMGKMLRIDVDSGTPYASPPDNPFAGGGGAPEVWALGFRNPFRWSFDSVSGDIYLGDVGAADWEEVNVVTVGGNYGWPHREGTGCWNASECLSEGLTDPIFQYDHSNGSTAIIGGLVYHGAEFPWLEGAYLYADRYAEIYALIPDGQGGHDHTELTEINQGAYGFAQGNDGSVYILASKRVYRMQLDEDADPPGSPFPDRLSETGCFDPVDPTLPDPALIPYDINAKLWSDGAVKERFMAIPNGTTIDVTADNWVYPIGTVLVKHFSLSDEYVETRLFVRHDDGGWAGYSYEWLEDQSDAILLEDQKVKDIDGQTYTYPSRSQCMQCHNESTGWSIGPETAQLNKDMLYPSTGVTDNQIRALDHIGMFTNPMPDHNTLDALADPFGTAPVDERARAYLHGNCAYCHRPSGPGQGPEDFRYQVPGYDPAGPDLGALMVDPTEGDMGVPGSKLLDPGNPENSVLSLRMKTLGAGRMPPLATAYVDNAGVAVIDGWILSGTGFGNWDDDGDEVPNDIDNCPAVANTGQEDNDSNGIGDACQDSDSDGVIDTNDAFPYDPTETLDTDFDGLGDNAEIALGTDINNPDSDGDGYQDGNDDLPLDPTEWLDTDGDGTGDNADELPNDPLDTVDNDKDGLGENGEVAAGTDANHPDTDGDGLTDGYEVKQSGTSPTTPDTVSVNSSVPVNGDVNNDGETNVSDLLRLEQILTE